MNKIITTILVIALLFIGGYFLLKDNKQTASLTLNQQSDEFSETDKEVQPSENTSSKDYKVTYTSSGYSPKELTIKVGDTVSWINESSEGLWTLRSFLKYYNLPAPALF